LAFQHNYQVGLHDFLYARRNDIHHPKGLAAIDQVVKFYHSRFGMEKL